MLEDTSLDKYRSFSYFSTCENIFSQRIHVSSNTYYVTFVLIMNVSVIGVVVRAVRQTVICMNVYSSAPVDGVNAPLKTSVTVVL